MPATLREGADINVSPNTYRAGMPTMQPIHFRMRLLETEADLVDADLQAFTRAGEVLWLGSIHGAVKVEGPTPLRVKGMLAVQLRMLADRLDAGEITGPETAKAAS